MGVITATAARSRTSIAAASVDNMRAAASSRAREHRTSTVERGPCSQEASSNGFIHRRCSSNCARNDFESRAPQQEAAGCRSYTAPLESLAGQWEHRGTASVQGHRSADAAVGTAASSRRRVGCAHEAPSTPSSQAVRLSRDGITGRSTCTGPDRVGAIRHV